MRYLVAVLLGVCGVSVVRAEQYPDIPVVKTWEELQALEPIVLGDGTKIRLGIEAAEIPQWSGALIYCLADGGAPPPTGGTLSLGPVQVQLTYGSITQVMDYCCIDIEPMAQGRYLYVYALIIDRVDAYNLAITDQQDAVLAKTKLTGTKKFFHPWMPWLSGYKNYVCPAEGIALPRVDALSPTESILPGASRTGRLRTFLPSDEKPSLTIKLVGNTISVHSESKIRTSRPEHHYLARWWVNGKPFVPKQLERLFGGMQGYGVVLQGKDLQVTFEFRPAALGAKPGDRIGLQLLHCERGWQWCAHDMLSVGLRREGEKDGLALSVSNRIEFQAPESTKNKKSP